MARSWLVAESLDLGQDAEWVSLLNKWIRSIEALGFDSIILGRIRFREQALDNFTVLGALTAGPRTALGIVGELGTGRSASVMAREVTTLDHLIPGGAALIMKSQSSERLIQASAVVDSLFRHERSSAGGDLEAVIEAPNLPPPRNKSGPPFLCWETSESENRFYSGTSRAASLEGVPATLENLGFERSRGLDSVTVLAETITAGDMAGMANESG